MSSKKLSGFSGTLTIGTAAEASIINDFQEFEFPSNKRECELLVASGFVKAAGALQITDLKQNDEDGFDFSMVADGVPADLELMEAAPLAGPFEKAPDKYRIGDYVDRLLAEIGKKEKKYRPSSERPIYLLLYVTHTAFIPSTSTIQSLQYWLRRPPSPFAAIFLYMPILPAQNSVCLYPADAPKDFHPNQVADRFEMNFIGPAIPVRNENKGTTFKLTVGRKAKDKSSGP
jgi:hypothetical protein